KRLLVFILIVFPLGSFASIITFHCKSAEISGIHKFDAFGIVAVDEQNAVEGIISLQVEKAQAPGSVQIFEEIKVQGSHQHFEAGQFSKNAFDQLNLTSKNNYIKSLNLLLDFNVEIASQVFSVDNFLYRSNCEIESVK
ncbi:MAG: hypothetical protein Q7U04_12305, partial [Bacteriovorax sp.]|nr:hypothetical protein [Bacteriovorax sp.]